MNAASTLGMSPARRRIFAAGYAAQRDAEAAAEAQREAAMQARRKAARDAIEAALAREETDKQTAIRAAAGRHPVSRIISEVAADHALAVADIVGPSRLGPIVLARQEAMWRARSETDLSFPAIGRRFGGRDHTTVIYSVRKHQKRLDDANR